jgi:hypothetical protein
MLRIPSSISRSAGRLGSVALRGARRIEQFESQLSDFNRRFTGGVAGELLKFTPVPSIYSSVRDPLHAGLKLTGALARSVETGKPGFAIKGALDLVDKYDPILRPAGMSVNPLYSVAQSPALQRFAL